MHVLFISDIKSHYYPLSPRLPNYKIQSVTDTKECEKPSVNNSSHEGIDCFMAMITHFTEAKLYLKIYF